MMLRNIFEDIRKTYDLRTIYHEFNKKYFNNELPDVKIKWYKSRTAGGRVTYKYNKRTGEIVGAINFDINYIYERNEESLLGIVLHEMLHVWQAINGYHKDGHGKYFLQKKREIESKLNYVIPLTDDVTNLDISSAVNIKPVDVFIRKYSNGNIGLTLYRNGYLRDNRDIVYVDKNTELYTNVKVPELIRYTVRRKISPRYGVPTKYNILSPELQEKIEKNGTKLDRFDFF